MKTAEELKQSILVEIVSINHTETLDQRYLRQMENITKLAIEYANQSKWISVEDRLPNDYERALFCSKTKPYIRTCRYKSEHKEFFLINYTHWQPLPNAPEKP